MPLFPLDLEWMRITNMSDVNAIITPMKLKRSNDRKVANLVTKNGKTDEYGYGLPWSDVRKEVYKHYQDAADAVELEMITKEEFDDRLPKPY